MTKFRDRLTYANVTATLALFVALGGTGYAAIQLPRNSVGKEQLRKGAVTSRSVSNGAIRVRDMSRGARRSLRGAQGPQGEQGPPGLTFHASVNSAGGLVRGNAVAGGKLPGDGLYAVQWSTDVSVCDAVATLASVPGGPVVDPPAGRITVRPSGTGIEVRTFDAAGAPADLPFTVAAAC